MMIERRGSFFFFLSKYFSTNDGKERLIVGAIVSIQLDRWNRLLITGTIVNKLWRIFDINIVNIIFIWCSSIGLRLAQRWNLPVKRRLRTWQQKVDEKSQRTGDRWLRLRSIALQSLTIILPPGREFAATDDTVTSVNQIFVHLSNHDIFSFPILPTIYSHWKLWIRKLWKFYSNNRDKWTGTILFSSIWKFYHSNDRGAWKWDDSILIDRYFENYENSIRTIVKTWTGTILFSWSIFRKFFSNDFDKRTRTILFSLIWKFYYSIVNWDDSILIDLR